MDSARAGAATADDAVDAALEALNFRERAFVVAYVGRANGNGTEACRQAGYEGDGDTLSVQSSRLLAKDRVRRALRTLLAPRIPEGDEILETLRLHKTADMSLFEGCWRDEVVKDEDGVVVLVRRVLDWPKVKAAGLGPLIRKVTPTKHGDSVELHDPQRAVELLGKFRALWTEKIEVSGSVRLDDLTDEQLAALAAGKRPTE